jgi:hypothetical protein
MRSEYAPLFMQVNRSWPTPLMPKRSSAGFLRLAGPQNPNSKANGVLKHLCKEGITFLAELFKCHVPQAEFNTCPY